MIKTKAIRKIFTTTLSMFIILCVFSLMTISLDDTLKVNLEINDISGVGNGYVYLLSKNDYLVRKNIYLDSDSDVLNIKKALSYLIDSDNNKYSSELMGVIPKDTKINEVICGDDLVTVDFSKEILNVSINHEKHMISSIVYTIMDLVDVDGISILVDGELLRCYPNTGEVFGSILNKSIGINNRYDITSRKDINRVILYYVDLIDEDIYYVPVTMYINDDREKVKIIIEELKSSYLSEVNLMSFLNSNVKLIDYQIENDIFFLNFDDYLFDSNDKILEEVMYTISYSIFDNYDVNMVMFLVNGEEVNHIMR
jgi:spore germination protein GerM